MKSSIAMKMVILTMTYMIETTKTMSGYIDFYGTWHIDKAVLKSRMYTGTALDGDVYLYDPEDYVGFELEYSKEFVRLGNQTYDNPKYNLYSETVKSYQNGGKFILPDLLGYIREEGIKLKYEDDVQYLSECKLQRFYVEFEEEIRYKDEANDKEYPFIPVVSQGVFLNDDTMLLGLWGKILVATRVEEEEDKEDNPQTADDYIKQIFYKGME